MAKKQITPHISEGDLAIDAVGVLSDLTWISAIFALRRH